MKKLLIYTFIDGTKKEFDFRQVAPPDMPIDAKPNDSNMVLWIARQWTVGVALDGNDGYIKWIPPSQIKSIELKFTGLQVSKN